MSGVGPVCGKYKIKPGNSSGEGGTHCMIFSLSSGLTTVRDAAPAIPPAMKYDVICGLKNGIALPILPFTAGLIPGAGEGDVMVECL